MSVRFINFANVDQNTNFNSVDLINNLPTVFSSNQKEKTIIYMNGIAGCGKSRVSKRLNDYLNSNGKKSYILSKDDFRYTDSGYVYTKEYETTVSKKYINKFKTLIKSSTIKYIILDNTHINYEKIRDTREIYKNCDFDEIIISIEPYKDLNKHINFNIHNIPFSGISRQFAEWDRNKKLIQDMKIKTLLFDHFEDGFIKENQINIMCGFFKFYIQKI